MATLNQALSRTASALERASVRALNRTADAVKTRAVRAMAQNLGIGQRRLREATYVARATASRIEARVGVRGKRIPVFEFSPRPAAPTRPLPAVGVSVKMGRRRKKIPGSFIARMESGHVGVFSRVGPKLRASRGRYVGQLRQAVTELFGPSLALVFARRKIQAPLQQIIRERLPREMAQAARFYMQGVRKR